MRGNFGDHLLKAYYCRAGETEVLRGSIFSWSFSLVEPLLWKGAWSTKLGSHDFGTEFPWHDFPLTLGREILYFSVHFLTFYLLFLVII